ncbi:GNAT family N-acetyltransferase [Crocosphaera sp. Alani8]|uniref:GNAT family N-acetyltransferase n=1 Tax=Crocosphaera sp. Alani8 TaxID=3038952 RepID=UPI00313B380C
MKSQLSTRKANRQDIPFLARIEYEASLPPLNHCFWEDLLEGTQTEVLPFIEAKLKADAGNWGLLEDFVIVEEQGKPVAAAAGYCPNQDNYSPLNLSNLDKMAQELNWSQEIAEGFRDGYLQFLGGNLRPLFLSPQATWIIETVAVLPEARGKGLGKFLIKALLEEGKRQQHSYGGIMILNGNDAARRTYEAVGFKPYQTFYEDYFRDQFNLEFPGVTKFGVDLNKIEIS